MFRIKHLKSVFWSRISLFPFPGKFRWRIVKLMGVKFIPSTDTPHKISSFIGNDVTFDTVYPELIEIHNHVHITAGCILLTHFLDTDSPGVKWMSGKIVIEENVFLGTRTIITKPVRIGKNSIIAAGSIITKDIPPNEIWGGVPAKFIKKRNL